MKLSAKTLALIAALTALATSAFANTVTFGANNSNYRTGSGGEFTLTPGAGDPDHLLNDYPIGPSGTNVTGSSFETFCIQMGEHISLGSTYFTGISDSAQGPTGTDHISKGTAWLYGQFAQGILANYTYTPGSGRANSASILQEAIWYLEDELTLDAAHIAANIFLTNATSGAVTHYGTSTAAKLDSTSDQGVRVLNLATTQYNADHGIYDAQDQLIWPIASVPEMASTIALLGLSLAGLAGFRRKFAATK